MIGRIAGRLEWKGGDQVLIDCHGVGYVVHVSARTLAAMPAPGEAVALHTELLVREDLLQLFGFATMIEREWHRLLTTVQGVGAKVSMAILGALGPEGVARAITLGDARAMQAAPGVGPKLAQRLILELKAKAPGLMALAGGLPGEAAPGRAEGAGEAEPGQGDGAVGAPGAAPGTKAGPGGGRRRGAAPPPPPDNPAAHAADALSALVNLGYGQMDAAEAVARAGIEAPGADTAALIRAALRLLAPRHGP